MAVEKKTLGLEEDGKINILDVKCDPDLVGKISCCKDQLIHIQNEYLGADQRFFPISFMAQHSENMNLFCFFHYNKKKIGRAHV